MNIFLTLSLLVAGLQLDAATLFSDNFESYTAGANLAGQGGWTGCGSIPIGTSSALPTQVVRADLGSAGCGAPLAGFALMNHSFSGSIGSNVITTLSFDAYAPTGAHSSGVWLTDLGGPVLSGLQLLPSQNVPGWALFLYENGGSIGSISIPGGTGVAVSFQLVIDVPGQVVYVIYDFGAGPQSTSTLSLAGSSSLHSWNTLSLVGDYRFGLPQDQIDNISLTQTPEPSTLLSMLLCGAGVIAMGLRRTARN